MIAYVWTGLHGDDLTDRDGGAIYKSPRPGSLYCEMGKVLRKPFAKAVPLLFLAATWLLTGVLPAGASSPTNAAAASLTEAQDQFYSYTCNADTFSPSLTSFASIWALLTLVLVIIASAIYLMYVCFNKFVNTLLTD